MIFSRRFTRHQISGNSLPKYGFEASVSGRYQIITFQEV